MPALLAAGTNVTLAGMSCYGGTRYSRLGQHWIYGNMPFSKKTLFMGLAEAVGHVFRPGREMEYVDTQTDVQAHTSALITVTICELLVSKPREAGKWCEKQGHISRVCGFGLATSGDAGHRLLWWSLLHRNWDVELLLDWLPTGLAAEPELAMLRMSQSCEVGD